MLRILCTQSELDCTLNQRDTAIIGRFAYIIMSNLHSNTVVHCKKYCQHFCGRTRKNTYIVVQLSNTWAVLYRRPGSACWEEFEERRRHKMLRWFCDHGEFDCELDESWSMRVGGETEDA